MSHSLSEFSIKFEYVSPQGSLARSGLVFIGDEIHEVNGRKIDKLSADEVCVFLKDPTFSKLDVEHKTQNCNLPRIESVFSACQNLHIENYLFNLQVKILYYQHVDFFFISFLCLADDTGVLVDIWTSEFRSNVICRDPGNLTNPNSSGLQNA